jgi:hypothetical protein
MIVVRLHIEPMGELPRLDKLTMLRGQISLMIKRAEQGIPIINSLVRAERVARSLELDEVERS